MKTKIKYLFLYLLAILQRDPVQRLVYRQKISTSLFEQILESLDRTQEEATAEANEAKARQAYFRELLEHEESVEKELHRLADEVWTKRRYLQQVI